MLLAWLTSARIRVRPVTVINLVSENTIEHRLPAPADLRDAVTGPLAPHWGDAPPLLRTALEQPDAFDVAAVLARLSSV